jgi:hypothetical protein
MLGIMVRDVSSEPAVRGEPRAVGKSPRPLTWVALALGLGGFLLAVNAASQAPDTRPFLERIKELERRVESLERRLAVIEPTGYSPSAVGESAVRSFPPEGQLRANCEPPYVVDGMGVAILKAECEQYARSSCDPLWRVDAWGLRSLRPGCEAAKAALDCANPSRADARGHRTVRRECLDVGY